LARGTQSEKLHKSVKWERSEKLGGEDSELF